MNISILKMIEKIKNPYIIFDKSTKEVIFSNLKAQEFIGDCNGYIDLNVVFNSFDRIYDSLDKQSNGEISDIYVNIPKFHEQKLANIYLGYFDDEKSKIYIEIQTKSNIKKMFEAIQELSTDILFMINIDKRLLFFRGELSEQLGLSDNIVNFPQSLIDSNVIHPDDVDAYIVASEDMLDGIQRSCDLRIRLNNGDFNWFSLSSVIVYDDYNRPIKVLGKLKNIQNNKDLEFKMSHDLLTKTLNKISLINCISEILHASDDTETHAFYYIDIDGFNKVNEKFGHHFADELLKNLSESLSTCVRETDLIGRVGIDEFVIFLPNIVCEDAIMRKAELILSKILHEFVLGDDKCPLKASIGISKYPYHGTTYNELQKKADIALYMSKEKRKQDVNGSNFATIFSE